MQRVALLVPADAGGKPEITTIRLGEPADAGSVASLWHKLEDVLPRATDNDAAVRELLEHDPEALLIADAAGSIDASLILGCDRPRPLEGSGQPPQKPAL